MKKLFVAAAVLGLAAVAAVGAIHVQRSIRDGVCPLTGRPIARHVMSPSVDGTAAPESGAYGDATYAAQDSSAAADQTECPRTHARCCCTKRHECEKAAQQEAPKPVEPPMQNP